MGVLLFFLLLLSFFFLALERSECATVVVDGVTQWRDPAANIGDTIIFKHKYNYNVYIFRTQDAFNSCNFTLATRLSNPNSATYTWHPSRPGYFYFSFYNETSKPCEEGQKLAVQVTPHSPPAHPPENPVIPPEIPPPATPGGVVSSSPAYPWPFQPREKASPGPITAAGGETTEAPAMAPMMPEKGGSIPFINSNPAVPLPTGEVDSATIRPLPTSANHAPEGGKVTRLIEGLISICFVVVVIL